VATRGTTFRVQVRVVVENDGCSFARGFVVQILGTRLRGGGALVVEAFHGCCAEG